MRFLRRRHQTQREEFGLSRLDPVSRMYGADRGKPVDRWYIERFLAAHTADVRGRVLEVAETTYTEWYGGDATPKPPSWATSPRATASLPRHSTASS